MSIIICAFGFLIVDTITVKGHACPGREMEIFSLSFSLKSLSMGIGFSKWKDSLYDLNLMVYILSRQLKFYLLLINTAKGLWTCC